MTNRKDRPPRGSTILKVGRLAEAILIHLEGYGEMQYHTLLQSKRIGATSKTDLSNALRMLQKTRLVKKIQTEGVTTTKVYSITGLGRKYPLQSSNSP